MAFTCSLCPKYFDTRPQMKKHKEIRHNDRFNSSFYDSFNDDQNDNAKEADHHHDDDASEERKLNKKFIRTNSCQLSSTSLLVRVHEYQAMMLAAHNVEKDSDRLKETTLDHQDSKREDKDEAKRRVTQNVSHNTMRSSGSIVKSSLEMGGERLGRLRSRLTILEQILCKLSNEVFIFGHVDNKSTDNLSNDVIEKLNDSAAVDGSSSISTLKSSPLELDYSNNFQGIAETLTKDKDECSYKCVDGKDNTLDVKTDSNTLTKDWSTLCQMIKSITRQTILNEMKLSSTVDLNTSSQFKESLRNDSHSMDDNKLTPYVIAENQELIPSPSSDVEPIKNSSDLNDIDVKPSISISSKELGTLKKEEQNLIKHDPKPVGGNSPLFETFSSQGYLNSSFKSFIREHDRLISDKFSESSTNNDVVASEPTKGFNESSQADVVLVETDFDQSNDRKLNSKHDSELLVPTQSEELEEAHMASVPIVSDNANEDGGDGDKSIASSLHLERNGKVPVPKSNGVGDKIGQHLDLRKASLADQVVVRLGKTRDPTSGVENDEVKVVNIDIIAARRKHQLEENKKPSKPIEGKDNDNLFRGSSESLSSGGGGPSGLVSIAAVVPSTSGRVSKVDPSNPMASLLCDSFHNVQQTPTKATEASSSLVLDNSASSIVYCKEPNSCSDKTESYNAGSNAQQSYTQQQLNRQRQIETSIVCSNIAYDQPKVGEEAEVGIVEAISVKGVARNYDELNRVAKPDRESTSNQVQVLLKENGSNGETDTFEAPLNSCNSELSLVDCCLLEQRAANGLVQTSSAKRMIASIDESNSNKPDASVDIVASPSIEQHPNDALHKDRPELEYIISEGIKDEQPNFPKDATSDKPTSKGLSLEITKLDGANEVEQILHKQILPSTEENSDVADDTLKSDSSEFTNAFENEGASILRSLSTDLVKETDFSVVGQQQTDNNKIEDFPATSDTSIYQIVDGDKGLNLNKEQRTVRASGEDDAIVILDDDNNDGDEVQITKTNKTTITIPQDSTSTRSRQLGENAPHSATISGQNERRSEKVEFKLKSILKRGNRAHETEGSGQWSESNSTSGTSSSGPRRGFQEDGSRDQVGRRNGVQTISNGQSQGRSEQTNRQAGLVSADWPRSPATRRRSLVRFSEIDSVLELSPTEFYEEGPEIGDSEALTG